MRDERANVTVSCDACGEPVELVLGLTVEPGGWTLVHHLVPLLWDHQDASPECRGGGVVLPHAVAANARGYALVKHIISALEEGG